MMRASTCVFIQRKGEPIPLKVVTGFTCVMVDSSVPHPERATAASCRISLDSVRPQHRSQRSKEFYSKISKFVAWKQVV